jgi:hypothetical protein
MIGLTARTGRAAAAALLALILFCCSGPRKGAHFRAAGFVLELDERGRVLQLSERTTGTNYLAAEKPSFLLSIRANGEILPPDRMRYDKAGKTITLHYPGGFRADVAAVEHKSHIAFEVLGLLPAEGVEMVIWGPYATTIGDVVGETVGVVRNEDFALGIQSLNPKTLGGFPWKNNDCMPQLDIFETGDYSDLSEEGKRHVLYRVEAAKPEDFGSTLQAYCRERRRERTAENWGHSSYLIPPFADGGVTGSRIALFGCPAGEALETIGLIELGEGLPHPLIDGRWGKTAPSAAAAYMILDFGEADIDRAIAYTKQAGLRYLYHSSPFKTWGHFQLTDQFPSGRAGLKDCVEKAEAAGLFVGVHTLSNFITTNDPYVTPVPDPRLARVGAARLTEDITASQREIPVSSPDLFQESQKSHLKTLRVEGELIGYGGLSAAPPWRLLDCRRGAFGTTAAPHKAETGVDKLADHAYKVFLTDSDLSLEVAGNIAGLFNECGLRQISFDGLEGNRSTGMGNYGEILFTSAWYDRLSEDIRRHFIADASRTSHYFWHIYSRMNWGEPWYAGFRESQTQYRLRNQAYFQRNLMPGMLGWFLMKPETSIEDVLWLLARSAAFDAGYAFVTGYEALEGNGSTGDILEAIGLWEEARMADAFSDAQKALMKDITNEFSLEADGRGGWLLTRIFTHTFRHRPKNGTPDEPSAFAFSNPAEEQALGFILTAEGAELSDIRLEIRGAKEIRLPGPLAEGHALKYSGGDRIKIMDGTWHRMGEIPVDPADLAVSPGDHSLLLRCRFSEGEKAAAKLEIRLAGIPEPAGKKRPARN